MATITGILFKQSVTQPKECEKIIRNANKNSNMTRGNIYIHVKNYFVTKTLSSNSYLVVCSKIFFRP